MMIKRNDPCWCKSGKKWKKCHFPSSNDPNKAKIIAEQMGIVLKATEQIEGIEKACQITSAILEELTKKTVAGVSTSYLNKMAEDLHVKYNAIPAPLNYGNPPFPASICTSINEEICHGIPSENVILKDGDILNIDASAIVNGYFGDASRMIMIGEVSKEANQLVTETRRALDKAITMCKPGVPFSIIGQTIENHVKKFGFSVVRDFVGHGVGIFFHEPPQVLHYSNNSQLLMCPGMIFTIEPMINAGSYHAVVSKDNNWTAKTADGKLSAQWEETILITNNGCRVLSELKKQIDYAY